MKKFYRYTLNKRRLAYGILALYMVVIVFAVVDAFVNNHPLSAIFYILMGGVNLLFPYFLLSTQNKVFIDSQNNKLLLSDKFFFVKPVIVDIDKITQIDFIKSKKSGKIYRLLVRLGDNVFYRVVVINTNEFTKELLKINSNIKIEELIGAPI